MDQAVAAAAEVRCRTSPNPWVGAVVVTPGGETFAGGTEEPGGAHAEVVALAQAGDRARGATMYVTLEPCNHHGRTPPCTEAIIAAGVRRVVVAITDPDPLVAGTGLERLRAAGIEVDVGTAAAAVEEQLAPYLHHRRTGRPWVVLKLAASMDGRTAAPDHTSQWITSAPARADAHRLRAESDAIVVGAGTVRSDNPTLTVRDYSPPRPPRARSLDPRRIVLGAAPATANVRPCEEYDGDLLPLLSKLGREGVLQVLVEGGAGVAHRFHTSNLVDRYVIYLAPVLFGGSDAYAMFDGPGAPTIADVWRGRLVDVHRLDPDIRVELAANGPVASAGAEE